MDENNYQWYSQPSFDSFWTNYRFGNEWLQKHGFNPVPLHFDEDAVLSHDEELPQLVDAEKEGDEDNEELISEEYLSFVMQTRKHQQERDMRKKEKERQEKVEDYKDISQIVRFTRFGEAPKSNTDDEQCGRKRKKELEQLYGKQASVIEGLETAMQLEFNNFCDTKNPKLWPILCRF